jgi:uncharacterized protein (TIGR02246 family)
MVPLLLPATLALVTLAAGPSSCGQRRPGAAPSLSERQLEQVMHEYLDAYHHDDPEALARLYATDGLLLPPGRGLVRGREAIRQFWEQGMEAGFQMETLEVRAGVTTGYAVGRYYIPADDENEAESGKYVITFARQADGVWRVAADIWNEDGDGSDDDDQQPDTTAKTVALGPRAPLPR